MTRQPAHTQQIRLDRGHPRRAARAHAARHRGWVADVGERNEPGQASPSCSLPTSAIPPYPQATPLF